MIIVPLFYCMHLFSPVNSVWHNFLFTHISTNTRHTTYEAAETGGNGARAGGSGGNNVNNNEHHREPHLPPPPLLTSEVLFAQLLGSQCNTEQS
jgi:hypothetical protein